jgi:lipoprotein-anchoring transpeptidase ErfK/SrfK
LKTNFKKVICAILATTMVMSSMLALNFSASAAEDESANIIESTESQIYTMSDDDPEVNPENSNPAEGEVTDPFDDETEPQTSEEPTKSGVLIGDVDKDGAIGIGDVTYVQKYIANLISLSEEALVAADSNGDGKIDIVDATLVQNFIAELGAESKIGERVEPVVTTTVAEQTTEEPTAVEQTTEPAEETTTAAITTIPTTAPTTTAPTTVKPTTAPTTAKPTTKPVPTLTMVKNVTKTSFESDRVDLTWDKVSGATGYAVYYRNVDKKHNYSKIKDVTTNSISVSNLCHTTSYYFKIVPYVIVDGVRYDGPAYEKKTATQPAAVSGLWLARSSNVIELRWNQNSLATGYKVYRACAKSNWEYVEYKILKGSSNTTFSDTNISYNCEYRYVVKAYRELYGNCIYHSTGVSKRAVCGLGAPDFNMTTQVSRVSLTWSANKYATGYDLFYSTSKNGTYKQFGTTKKTFYNTSRLTNGQTYYFRVRPYKTVGSNKIVGTYYTYSKTVTNKAYGQSVGNTYIEISIRQQYMWYYIDGKEYCSTSVVTGNDDGYSNTPKGTYKIWQRLSPTTLVGDGYSSYVNYWLAFTYSGCGIHDASWRSSSEYGGTTYQGNGSHGCVNTPYDAVKKIYQKAGIGTYVVVY